MARGLFLFLSCVLWSYASIAQVSDSPMSCKIKGKILCVCKSTTDDTESPCAKYPCNANVLVLDVSNCGFSVTNAPQVGDTIRMNFAFTLHKTKKAMPELDEHYPGLKRKKIFTANAEQILLPKGAVAFKVYGYTKH